MGKAMRLGWRSPFIGYPPTGDYSQKRFGDKARYEQEEPLSRIERFRSKIHPAQVRSELRALMLLRYGTLTYKEAERAILETVGSRPEQLSREELGEILSFSFVEYKCLGNELLGRRASRHPATIMPVDADQGAINDYLHEFHRPRRNEAARRSRALKRQKREAAAAAITADGRLTLRAKSTWLKVGNWTTVSATAKSLQRDPAWRRPDGKQMSVPSIKRRLNALVPELHHVIECKTVIHPKGFPIRYIKQRIA